MNSISPEYVTQLETTIQELEKRLEIYANLIRNLNDEWIPIRNLVVGQTLGISKHNYIISKEHLKQAQDIMLMHIRREYLYVYDHHTNNPLSSTIGIVTDCQVHGMVLKVKIKTHDTEVGRSYLESKNSINLFINYAAEATSYPNIRITEASGLYTTNEK